MTSHPDSTGRCGTDTLLADAEEHRAFRNSHEQITAHEVMVLGISSPPAAKLHEALTANCMCHPLASDTTLRLAELLKLPMFRDGAAHFYERLTIIITRARSPRSSIRSRSPAGTPKKFSPTSKPPNELCTKLAAPTSLASRSTNSSRPSRRHQSSEEEHAC